MSNNENTKNTRYISAGAYDSQIFKDEVNRANLRVIYQALCEKGYNPIAQLSGYVLSSDPTYITTHNNARIMITRIDRDDILRILMEDFFKDKD